jgi:hypothetical protein
MSLSRRHFTAGALIVAGLAVSLGLASGRTAVGASRGAARAAAAVAGEGPRNLKAEAASGDNQQMVAVLQEAVDCLRAKGYSPGDPMVRGRSVVIDAWNPSFDSVAGQATESCSFPDR